MDGVVKVARVRIRVRGTRRRGGGDFVIFVGGDEMGLCEVGGYGGGGRLVKVDRGRLIG